MKCYFMVQPCGKIPRADLNSEANALTRTIHEIDGISLDLWFHSKPILSGQISSFTTVKSIQSCPEQKLRSNGTRIFRSLHTATMIWLLRCWWLMKWPMRTDRLKYWQAHTRVRFTACGTMVYLPVLSKSRLHSIVNPMQLPAKEKPDLSVWCTHVC